jgi:hypothetical protein
MDFSHRANDRVSVAFPFNVQITQEQVKLLSFYLLEVLAVPFQRASP